MFVLYELAMNPDCQERLHHEISEAWEKCNGNLTYDDLQGINYLEWVILEAIRIHPPLMVMAKICTRKYTLPKATENGEPLTIYPGTSVHIPVHALQK